RRRHTSSKRDWSSDVCSSDLEICGDPIILKLIEYSAIIINIPDKSAFIFPFVCRIPVIQPAKNPAKVPIIVAINGGNPFIIETAATAAPVTKLPSTVKSGKSSTRKDK